MGIILTCAEIIWILRLYIYISSPNTNLQSFVWEEPQQYENSVVKYVIEVVVI